MSTYLIVGGLYVDHIHTVESYPEEDTAIRALATRRSRGGNAATSAVVLSQLLGGARGDVVRLMCAAPISDPDTAFELASLAHEAALRVAARGIRRRRPARRLHHGEPQHGVAHHLVAQRPA